MSLQTLLLDTVNVTRPTLSGYDDYGNSETVYSTIYSSIKCRIVESSGLENITERDSTVRNALAFFDAGITLSFLDRVIKGSDTWEVSAPPLVLRDSLAVHHLEVSLRLVTA